MERLELWMDGQVSGWPLIDRWTDKDVNINGILFSWGVTSTGLISLSLVHE